MGKAAKAHRAKVAKRNANLKVQEKRMQKVWQEAFQEQMEKMKEQFALMSGDTMSGLTGLLEDEENTQTDITEEESESVEPISGDQTV
jgi:rubrerythrin